MKIRSSILVKLLRKNKVREMATCLWIQYMIQISKAKRSYSTFKIRRGGCEEIPLVQGQEQWLHFAGAAIKRYSIYQGKRNPSKTVGVATGQTHWNHNHRKLANPITWTTALSNSMKLSHAVWSHPGWAGHGGEVWQNVVHWRREWQTTSVFLPWEPHEQYEKEKW